MAVLLVKLLLLVVLIGLHSINSNLLCETDRWNEISGNWVYNSSTCVLHTTRGGVSLMWFGDLNGDTPDTMFNSFTSFSLSIDILIESGYEGSAEILFRAQSVSSGNAQQYFLALRPSKNKTVLMKIDDEQSVSKQEIDYYIELKYDTIYNVLIESMANDITHYNIHLNNTLLFSYQLPDFINGSIGLRGRKAPTFYYNLNYSSIPMVPVLNSTNIASFVTTLCGFTSSESSPVEWYCYDELECNNETIIVNDEIVECWGRAACAGGEITNIGNESDAIIRCWGERSCQSLSQLTEMRQSNIGLHGYLAAAWTKIIDVPTLNCAGEAACYSVGNILSHDLTCAGFRSCAEITGTDNYRVEGYGTLSLENSILHNPSNVILQGFYAGYNGTIYCDYSKRCNISCYSHACVNLNLVCGSIDNGTICNRTNNIMNSMYNVSCNESQGIICPNGWGNNSNYDNWENNNPSLSYKLLEKILNLFNYTRGMNLKTKYVKNLDYSECNTYNDTDDNDLSWASSINYTLNNLQCSDSWECYNISIIDKKNVCCDATESCLNAKITSFNNLFCGGKDGCTHITGDAAMTNGDVYVRARRAAQVTYAGDSDRGTIISNFGSMMIGTTRGVRNTGTVSNGVNVASLGNFGTYSFEISGVSNIYAAGHKALYESEVHSGGIGEMNIYLLGHQSGYDTDITCDGNDVCNIYYLTEDARDQIGQVSCDSGSDACTINWINGLVSSTDDGLVSSTNEPPHNSTQVFETEEDEEEEEEEEYNNLQLVRDFDRTGQYIVFVGAILAGLFVSISFIYYKQKVQGVADSTGYLTVGKFFLQLSDLFTDLFFNVILYLKNTSPILTYISIGSILLSYFGSIFICVFWLIRWKAWQEHVSERLHKYLRKYGGLLMGLTVISNFYVSVDLLRSKLFYRSAFYFPLTKSEYAMLKKYRFFNITICENVVQFITQLIYLYNVYNSDNNDDARDVNSIVFISIVFSAFSIFLSLMKFCVDDSQSKILSLEKKFGAKLVIDGSFTIESDKFVLFHAFAHRKIEKCLTRFLNDEIDLSIGGNSTIDKNDISLSCDVYYIENVIQLQNELKIHFITEVLHYQNDLTLANGIYNILSSLINDNNNNSRERHGTLSIVDKQTSTDTKQLKLHSDSNSMSPHRGDMDDDIPHIGDFARFVQGSVDEQSGGESDEIKLSPNGGQNFLKLISKALKIEENGNVGIKFVVNQSYANELTKVSSDRSKNIRLSNILNKVANKQSATSLRSLTRKRKSKIEMSLNKLQNNNNNNNRNNKEGDVQYAE